MLLGTDHFPSSTLPVAPRRAMMRNMRYCVLVLAVAMGSAPAHAESKPKIAALVLKTGNVDEELADNLTEVLIARLASRGDHEISGKEELKAKLGVDERAAADCMQNLSCLGRAGTELGVTRMVVGTLGRRGTDYLYNLSLIDLASGKVENRVFEMVAGATVNTLINAVASTADRLFQPKVEPGSIRVVSEVRGAMVYLDDAFIGASPIRRDSIDPGTHGLRVEKEGHIGWKKEIDVPPGSMMQIMVPLAALPERRRWPTRLAIATVVMASLTAVVGTVLVALSTNAPNDMAVVRRDALESANTRFIEGRVGIGVLAGAGALALTSVILAVAFRKDIFGASARESAARENFFAKRSPGGIGVGGDGGLLTVRW